MPRDMGTLKSSAKTVGNCALCGILEPFLRRRAACRRRVMRMASTKKPLGEKAEGQGQEMRGMGRASVVFILDIDHSRLGAMNEFRQGVVPAIWFDPGIDRRVEELGEVGGETNIFRR